MYYFLNDHCENSTSSPVLEVESSAAFFSDIPASVLSKLNLTAGGSCSSGSETESCHDSQSGTTFEPSMDGHGEDWSMLSAVAFRARTSVSEGVEQGSTESEADYGEKWREPFAKWSRDTCLWKTAQPSLFEELGGFSGTWPRWGMMQGGECFHANRQAVFTYESGFGLRLPTTGANEFKGAGRNRFSGSPDFRGAKMSEGLRTCEQDPIYLNPSFAEWVMMWPLEWTDLKPLVMVKFQEWLRSHGEY